jgi:hypothetical protein
VTAVAVVLHCSSALLSRGVCTKMWDHSRASFACPIRFTAARRVAYVFVVSLLYGLWCSLWDVWMGFDFDGVTHVLWG